MLPGRTSLALSTPGAVCFAYLLAMVGCRTRATTTDDSSSARAASPAMLPLSGNSNDVSAGARPILSQPDTEQHESATEPVNAELEGDGGASAPLPVRGRIVCGKRSCRTGKEICCRSEVPGKVESRCVPVTAQQLRDFGPLDELCDKRGALLVACDESASCGEGRVCCETIWGSGENTPIVCTEPREGERHPCEYREPCVKNVPCVTAGAECVDGWCIIPWKRPLLRCGAAICKHPKAVCCARNGASNLECSTRCEPPDMRFDCTRPSDCAPGNFCGVTPGGGGCMHSNDGNTSFMCDSPADCPPSVKKQCDGLEKGLACAPSSDVDSPVLVGKKICQCQP